MTAKFLARAVSFTNDGYSTLLGLAENASNPINYIMLNMTNDPDEQDLSLDQGGIHIDAGALNIDGYNLVQDIRKTESGLIITLTINASRKAGIGQDIEIEMDCNVINGLPVDEIVQIFKDRLLSLKQVKS